MYAPLIDERAAMINDPVVLRLGEDHFCISIADADILLWAKGLAVGMGLDVDIREPDVSPLAIQGPKSFDLAAELLGEWTRELKFFHHREFVLNGIPLVVARSGWSKQGGFELYLRDSQFGEVLWDRITAVGKAYNLRAGCPNLIERIESGLLSYGNDMTQEHNPLECGLERYCQIDKPAPYIGREALEKIHRQGVTQHVTGVRIAGEPIAPNRAWLDVSTANEHVGMVTSAVYSPNLKANIGIAMLATRVQGQNTEMQVHLAHGSDRSIETASLPFVG
jgi:glycine cleavage system aminomethyltransferase T